MRYMPGITVCVITYTVWMIIESPREIAFLVPTLLAVPAWLGVRREIGVSEKPPSVSVFNISKRDIVLLVIILITLFSSILEMMELQEVEIEEFDRQIEVEKNGINEGEKNGKQFLFRMRENVNSQ